MTEPRRVAVCIVTFRRPAGLRRLLDALGALRFREGTPPPVEVIVVDNDGAGSAQPVCDAAAAALPWPLRYVVEPRRGISMARNRAVAAAGTADLVAFIDDDEVPSPAWLDQLLLVLDAHGADAAAGPVVPRFDRPPPRWAVRGRFYERDRRPTGSPVVHPGIGNALVRTRWLRAVPFDERFALSGGEDTRFFLELAKRGARTVWADEAVVAETVPPSRVRIGWLLRRALRCGNTWALCECELRPGASTRVVRAAKGLARAGQGLAALLLAPVLGTHAGVRGLRALCTGAGNLAGVVGLRIEEYRTHHGG